ncbi:MAG TPA: efflux RND transporter periplasmic adaptor subunit [Thermoanaerobaculia bacterium]
MRKVVSVLFLLTLSSVLTACFGVRAEGERASSANLVVRRGPLRPRLMLTGELAAARSDALIVPRTPSWQLQVRWIAEDGTPVRAGEKVVELDNSTFTSDLEEKKLSASQAANELARKEAETRTQAAEKEFQVQQKRSELEKARVAAAVPAELMSLRERQERQLALRRAEVDLAKAEEELAAHRKASAADIAVQRISLEKSRREIRQAESAIEAVTLRAPRDGIVVVGEHPWEGRKLREGDSAWVGMVAASLPDLSSMIVEADLSDVDDGRIAPGMEALCVLDTYPSETFRGRVVDISAVAQEGARRPLLRSFAVKIRLDRVDPRRMRPGMSVRAEVLSPEIREALLAPRAALDLSADPPRALLADGGSTPVRLGPCSAAECVVEGLKEGTRLRSRDGGRG